MNKMQLLCNCDFKTVFKYYYLFKYKSKTITDRLRSRRVGRGRGIMGVANFSFSAVGSH